MPTQDHSGRNTRRIAYSAGGVIYRDSRVGLEVALIATHQNKRWGLPKGHVRWGESAEDAAVREIAEETGLTGTIERHLATIDYWFRIKNIRVHKYVDFFLVRYTDGALTPQTSEVDDVRWIPLEDACKLVSFARERDILAQVHHLSDTQQLGDE